jgi:hypothetical protein
MADEMMPPGAPAQQQPPAPEQGADPAEAPMALQEALTLFTSGMAESGSVPPEAMKELETAVSSYNKFLSMYGQAIGVDMPDVGQAKGQVGSEMTAGSKGAVPAGMPAGKGIKPVPVG